MDKDIYVLSLGFKGGRLEPMEAFNTRKEAQKALNKQDGKGLTNWLIVKVMYHEH